MNNITQRFSSEKFEQQYQTYFSTYRFEFLMKQRILLLPLVIFYIIAKITEESWFALGLNLIIVIPIAFSLKYKEKVLKIYNMIFIGVLILFNLYYAVSFYISIHPQRYQYIDGYFVAILTLAVVNTMESLEKYLILLFLYIVLIVCMANPSETLWQQVIKFLSYVVIYAQQQYYQQKLIRSTFLECQKYSKIVTTIKKNSDMKCFVTHFNSNKQQIVIESDQKCIHDEENDQLAFLEYIRKIHIVCKQEKHQLPFSAKSNRINLEQFLFYYFTNPEKVAQILVQCHEARPCLNGTSKNEQYDIKVIRCFDISPCLILLITENQKEQYQKKIKLSNKQTNQLLNYFQDIFVKEIRVSLIILKGIKINFTEIVKNKMRLLSLLNNIQGKLYVAQNHFYNIKDFLQPNSDFNNICLNNLDLVQLVQDAVTYVKHCDAYDCKIELMFNTKSLIVLSDQKLLSQLFINLIQFSSNHSKEVEMHFQYDQDLSLPPKELINISIYFSCNDDMNIYLKNQSIVNPQTIEEQKKNCNNELNLNISVALLIIRHLGPFEKITFRNTGRNQYMLQFVLYKYLDFNSTLIPIISLNPKEYITKKEDWQMTSLQVQKKISKQFTCSPRQRIDTCRVSSTQRSPILLEQTFN